MSFAFASFNDYGMVVSADRRLVFSTPDGNPYVSTDNSRKLFISKQGYVLTFTGCAFTEGKAISVIISDLWEKTNEVNSLLLFFTKFMGQIAAQCKENIVFLACGYENGSPKIYTSTTTVRKIDDMGELAYSGESELGEKLLTATSYVLDSMELQDRMNFHRFITQSIAKMQFYSDEIQTVSEECDIVALDKRGILFSSIQSLH